MKLFLAGLAIAALAAWKSAPESEVVVLIAGQWDGYTSPCGCVKPMQGGIRRLATAVKQNTREGATLFVTVGSLTLDQGRQSEIKAETIAQVLGSLNVDAVGIGIHDLRQGYGTLEAIQRLTGKKVVESGFTSGHQLWSDWMLKHGLTVGGINAQIDSYRSETRAEEIPDSMQVPPDVLLVAQGLDEARALARRWPTLKLIAYVSNTDSPPGLLYEGQTALVSPSKKGKYLLRLNWDGEKFYGYQAVALGPEFGDDAEASRFFTDYQKRIARENLLGKMPRKGEAKFAGSQACGTCHSEAEAIWKDSKHAEALKTLEDVGQDRDPDCVGCHVVGLSETNGFISRKETPSLTDVGCESCHGAGLDHSLAPEAKPMPKIGPESCMPCHNAQHSPGFDFETYWEKIKH